jgi:hypothetical protein
MGVGVGVELGEGVALGTGVDMGVHVGVMVAVNAIAAVRVGETGAAVDIGDGVADSSGLGVAGEGCWVTAIVAIGVGTRVAVGAPGLGSGLGVGKTAVGVPATSISGVCGGTVGVEPIATSVPASPSGTGFQAWLTHMPSIVVIRVRLVPSALTAYRLGGPSRPEAKTTIAPSGDQAGAKSSAGCPVSRVSSAPSALMT